MSHVTNLSTCASGGAMALSTAPSCLNDQHNGSHGDVRHDQHAGFSTRAIHWGYDPAQHHGALVPTWSCIRPPNTSGAMVI
jgi:hypothetical protein